MTILLNRAAGVAATMPTNVAGQRFTWIDIAGSTANVITPASGLIGGQASYTMVAYEAVQVEGDGTNWYIL
jgi:hypothetical protein